MVRKTWNLRDIRREGLEALVERLGPVATIRFLQQYETGRGDYTAERHRWLDGLKVADIVAEVRKTPKEREP